MDSDKSFLIFASAGEFSGLKILKQLKIGLINKSLKFSLFQLAGSDTDLLGGKTFYPIKKISVNGILDVIKSFVFIFKALYKTKKWLSKNRPDLVILIDYPGFNRKLLKYCKKIDLPVYYICPPQTWAYKKKWIGDFKGVHTQVLFPMEEKIYQEIGAQVYQGHFFTFNPQSSNINTGLTILPGSRLGTVNRNLPQFLKILRQCKDYQLPKKLYVVAPKFLWTQCQAILNTFPIFSQVQLSDELESSVHQSRMAIAFPGTVTMELALLKIPALVLGFIDPLTYLVGKKTLKTKHLSLPNIITDSSFYPEIIIPGKKYSHKKIEETLIQVFNIQKKPKLPVHLLGSPNGNNVAVKNCLRLLANK